MLGLRQAGSVTEKKKCLWCCKKLPVDRFTTNPRSGQLYSKCEECRPKHKATCHTSANHASAQRKYFESDKCKEAQKRYAQSDKGKEAKKRYKQSDKGKECDKRFNQSDKGKEVQRRANKRFRQSDKGKEAFKRYVQSDKGKEAQKRYREGEAGQSASKRYRKRRTSHRQVSSAMRLDKNVARLSNLLISSRVKRSKTFIKRTGFCSETAFLSAVRATFPPDGSMTFKNHGTKWQLDHKIPREAYDFDNPEDVKRCWSAKNIQAITPEANKEKSWKLVDQYIAEAGVECFPISWNGKFPDTDFKIAHSAKMLTRKKVSDDGEAGPSKSHSDDEEWSSYDSSDCDSSEEESSDEEEPQEEDVDGEDAPDSASD